VKKFDPYRLDRRLMKPAAKETALLRQGGYAAYKSSLEKELAAYCGRKYCVLTGSGREALRLAALTLRPRGGTAAFPDITHPSLAEAVSGPGFKPRPLDIDPDTLNLSLRALEAAASRLDLLILPHMFSTPAPIKEAARLARRHGFALIEDASQIIGGGLGAKKFGSFGDISVFSLSPYKPVSSPFCRAGAVLCDSPALFKKLMALKPAPPKPEALPFIRVKLRRLDETLAGLRRVNALYRKELAGLEDFFPHGISDAAQEFPLRAQGRAAAEDFFKKAGLPLERPYRPLHLEKQLPGEFPEADRYWSGAFHLPAWPLLSAAECRRAAAAAREVLQAALPEPSYVALDLTYRCGFSCPFCFVKNNSLRKAGRRELGTAAFKRIIASFAGAPKRFYVTGGEPSLRKDLPELVKAIKAGGHRCLITTNAYALTPAAVGRLAAAGADELVISLHGGPAAHDQAAGTPGAFRRVAAAVKLVKALPAPRPAVTLWCTINRANHASLPAVHKAMAALGADHIAFNHLEYISKKDFEATAAIFRKDLRAAPSFRPSEHLVRGIDAAALAAGVAAVKKANTAVKFYPDLDQAAMRAWYDPALSLKKPGRCAGQWNAAWVSPYGELLSCQPLAYKLAGPGSSPAKSRSGAAYAAFRRSLLKAGGFFPSCGRCGREPYQPKKRGSSC
jgi:dTDP-4-amino-4,6-dideoxygalactose transaminase/MoaA/NifB/PqqE/SkfB family radical SAM enzyme